MIPRPHIILLTLFVVCLPCHGFPRRVLQGSLSQRTVASWTPRQPPNFAPHRLLLPTATTITSRLILYKSPREEEDDKLGRKILGGIQIPSPYTLLIDSLAVLLAVELVGVVQEVNDVDFARNGGWFQPLPTIEEQSMSISHLVQAWILNMALWATSLTVVPAAIGQEQWHQRDANPWTTRFVPTFLAFLILRLLYAASTFVGGGGGGGDSVSWEAALLDAYIVGLLLATARHILGNEE